MARIIVKLQDRYTWWSTVVDAPVECFMSRDELRQVLLERGLDEDDLDAMLTRADEQGTSKLGLTSTDLVESNRAGDNESALTEEELLREYAT